MQMENKQSATPTQPLGMCEKLFNAISVSPAFRPIRRLSYLQATQPAPPSPPAPPVAQVAPVPSNPKPRQEPTSAFASSAGQPPDKTSGPKPQPISAKPIPPSPPYPYGGSPTPAPAPRTRDRPAEKTTSAGLGSKHQDKAQLAKIGTTVGSGPDPSPPAPAGPVSEGKATVGPSTEASRPAAAGEKGRKGPPKTRSDINKRVEDYINRAKVKIRSRSGIGDVKPSA